MRYVRAISKAACVYLFASSAVMAQSTGKSYTNTIEIGKTGIISSEEKIKATREEEAKKESERLERRKEIAEAKAKRMPILTPQEEEAKTKRRDSYANVLQNRRERKAASINSETRAKNNAVIKLGQAMGQQMTWEAYNFSIEEQNRQSRSMGLPTLGPSPRQIIAQQQMLEALKNSTGGSGSTVSSSSSTSSTKKDLYQCPKCGHVSTSRLTCSNEIKTNGYNKRCGGFMKKINEQ